LDLCTALGVAKAAFLKDGELDALALGEGHPRFGGLANNEYVGKAGGEGVASRVLNVDNVERTGVSFDARDGANTASVSAGSEHAQVANIELDEINLLASGKVYLNSVMLLDEGVGVSDGAAIVGGDEWDALLGQSLLVYTAELVLGFFTLDAVKDETALGVVKETEGVASLGDGDNIHETCGETFVSADLAVNLYKAFHADSVAFSLGEGVLKAVTEDDDEGKGLTELVRASTGAGGPDTVHLAEHPMLGSIQTLKVLLGTTCHC